MKYIIPCFFFFQENEHMWAKNTIQKDTKTTSELLMTQFYTGNNEDQSEIGMNLTNLVSSHRIMALLGTLLASHKAREHNAAPFI